MIIGVRGLAIIGVVAASAQPCLAADDSQRPFQDPNANSATLQAGANSFAEGQARSLLESKGFSQVTGLVNDSEGIWRGKAVWDNRPVDVSVDYRGHVVAQ